MLLLSFHLKPESRNPAEISGFNKEPLSGADRTDLSQRWEAGLSLNRGLRVGGDHTFVNFLLRVSWTTHFKPRQEEHTYVLCASGQPFLKRNWGIRRG